MLKGINLKDRLAELDSKLYNRLINEIRPNAERILEPAYMHWYTDHGIKHSERVINHASSMVTMLEGTSDVLEAEEIFIFCASAYLHDIGMQYLAINDETGKPIPFKDLQDEDFNKIREQHPAKSFKMISKSVTKRDRNTPNLGMEEDEYLPFIAWVSKGHGTDYFEEVVKHLSKYEKTTSVNGKQVRAVFLTALLLLADEMDLAERVNVKEKEIHRPHLPLDSEVHWYKHHYIRGASFDKNEFNITFEFHHEVSEEIQRLFRDWVYNTLNDRLQMVDPHLRELGGRISIKIPSPKIEENKIGFRRPVPVEVANELKRIIIGKYVKKAIGILKETIGIPEIIEYGSKLEIDKGKIREVKNIESDIEQTIGKIEDVNLLLLLGNMELLRGQYDKAENYYKQAVCFQPNLAEAHYNIQHVLIEGRRYDEALSAYEQATSIKNELAAVPSNYRLTKLLGICDSGLLYKAYDKNIDRTVVIELLKTSSIKGKSIEEVKSYLDNLKALDKCENIGQIQKVCSHRNKHYIIMEDFDGRILRDIIIDEGKLQVQRALDIALQLCETLKSVHEQGIVHGKVNPMNIFLYKGRMKLIGFESPYLEGLLHPGDYRLDIISVGNVLYEMLTGADPEKDLRRLPSSLNAEVSDSIDRIIERSLLNIPSAFKNIGEVIGAVRNVSVKKKKILVVEDQSFWYEALIDAFKREGADYEVVWVKSSGEALEKLKAEEFDAILLDMILPPTLTTDPVVEGIELCKRIKKDLLDVPIIAITIRPTETAKEEVMAAGADYFITKPFDPRDLCEIVNKAMLST